MDGPDPLKHRLKLWLKSEQAMGLPSVPRVEFEAPPAELAARPAPQPPPGREPTARPAPPPPQSPRANVASPAATRQTDWFGAPPAQQPGAASKSASGALPVLDTPIEGPVLSRDDKLTQLAALDRDQVKGCVKCGLHRTRDKTVFGEGPGRDEDASGRPFVGRTGQNLRRGPVVRTRGVADGGGQGGDGSAVSGPLLDHEADDVEITRDLQSLLEQFIERPASQPAVAHPAERVQTLCRNPIG